MSQIYESYLQTVHSLTTFHTNLTVTLFFTGIVHLGVLPRPEKPFGTGGGFRDPVTRVRSGSPTEDTVLLRVTGSGVLGSGRSAFQDVGPVFFCPKQDSGWDVVVNA